MPPRGCTVIAFPGKIRSPLCGHATRLRNAGSAFYILPSRSAGGEKCQVLLRVGQVPDDFEYPLPVP